MAVFGRFDIYYPDGRVEQLALAGEWVSVGSAADNSLVLNAEKVAPHHFRLRQEMGTVHLYNLDFVNGTQIAGSLLLHSQPCQLPEITDIRIGKLRIVFYPGSDQPTIPMDAVAESTQPIQLGFSIALERYLVEVFPASKASVEIEITNLRLVETRFQISVSGLPEGWAKLGQSVASIASAETYNMLLHIVPPRRAEIPPADYPATIIVHSLNEPERAAQLHLTVRLGGIGGLSLALDPPLLPNGETFRLFLLNQGNAPLRLHLRLHMPNAELDVELSQRSIQLSAGQRSQISGRARAGRPFTGQAKIIPFALLVQAENASAYLAAVPASVLVQPRVSRRLLFAIFVFIAAICLAVAAILSQPPAPSIASFGLSQSQVASGTPVELNWQAEAAGRYVIEVDRVAVAELADDASSYTLSTDGYIDPVKVALIALQGDKRVIETRQLVVHQPVTFNSISTNRTEMQRKVRERLVLKWDIEGALRLDIRIPDGFETLYDRREDDGSGELALSAVPETDFELILIAEDEIGTVTEQRISIRTEYPECTPIRDALLFAGPDSRFQQTHVAISNVPVLVSGITESKEWLKAELANGGSAWGLLSNFFCEDFDPVALTVISDVPKLPTPTLIVTATPTMTPAFIGTSAPTAEPTIGQTDRES